MLSLFVRKSVIVPITLKIAPNNIKIQRQKLDCQILPSNKVFNLEATCMIDEAIPLL
jgi:hypothetical protein